jgi:predicted small secreted protein
MLQSYQLEQSVSLLASSLLTRESPLPPFYGVRQKPCQGLFILLQKQRLSYVKKRLKKHKGQVWTIRSGELTIYFFVLDLTKGWQISLPSLLLWYVTILD